MRKNLLFGSVVCVLLVQAHWASARDVQLRPRGSDDSGNTSSEITSQRSATSNLSTEDRLNRLERILDNQGLVDMLLRLDSLQNEMQALRGEIELHTHQLEEIKQRQRDLYVDIDRRLLRLERNAPAGAAVEPLTPTGSQSSTSTASVSGVSKSSTTSKKQVTGPAANKAGEQKAYQKAFDLLRELRYNQAIKAFRVFLEKYPQGRYAHIARYWIGEANYAQRNFKSAIQDYQVLIKNYPQSPKLAEAMLKVGYSQYELKQYKKAQATLKQLLKSYPGTTEAGQAQNLLRKIRLKRG